MPKNHNPLSGIIILRSYEMLVEVRKVPSNVRLAEERLCSEQLVSSVPVLAWLGAVLASESMHEHLIS